MYIPLELPKTLIAIQIFLVNEQSLTENWDQNGRRWWGQERSPGTSVPRTSDFVTVIARFLGQLYTNLDTLEKKLSTEVLPTSDWPVAMPIGYFLVQWGRGLPTVDSAIPEQVVLGCVRKAAEQAGGNKAVSFIPPWSLLQFWPSGSALSFCFGITECWTITFKLNKSFPSQITLSQCFITVTGRQTRIRAFDSIRVLCSSKLTKGWA